MGWKHRMRNLNTQMARMEARNASNNSGCRKTFAALVVVLIAMVGLGVLAIGWISTLL